MANGMQFYVRACSKPKGRATVALVIKVGSVVEEEDEQGVAHIVEHLAFNATEQFSNHEIVKFLERIGAQFGACQNAYTSADETVYEVVVPTDKDGSLDPDCALLADALRVFAQFAFHIRCSDSDLSKERGAVLEEWRMSRDASGRTAEAHFKCVMQGSRYADRLPIGKEQVVRTVPASKVKAFYERWYRPEHMAVVVVGDVPDVQQVAGLVQAAFQSGISRDPSPPPPIPSFDFAPHAQPRYLVYVDKEAQTPLVLVSFKHPRQRMLSPADYLEHLQSWAFQVIVNHRLFRLSREQEPVLLSGSAGDESLTRTTQTCVLSASALEGGSLQALEALLVEVARIRQHGITARELSHALADLKSEIENTYREREQSHCTEIRDEYVRNFLYAEFVVGAEQEARLGKTLLPRVTTEAVQAVAARFHPSQSCVIKVVEHRKVVSEADLEAVVQRVMQMEEQGLIPAGAGEAVLPEQLLPHSLLPLSEEDAITSERQLELLGATEWKLSNGLVVVLKETDFLDDQLMMTGVAAGGLSEVPRAQHYTAACSGVVAGQLGIFGLKPALLSEFLSGTRIDLHTSEGAYSRKLTCELSPQDLEVALQLVHLLFTTHVQVDDQELKVVVRMLHESVAAQQRNPLTHYHNRVRAINMGNCYYFRPMTHEDVDQVDTRLACDHHNRSYRNPAEFKIVFTGKMSRTELMPLMLKYLATLPPQEQPPPRPLTDITPLEWASPAQPVVEDVPVEMVSPITQAQLTFPITLTKGLEREQVVWLDLVCRVLETRLLQRMRFTYGDVYTVSVAPFFGCEAPSNKGAARGDVSICFTCDPLKRHHLIEMALQEVEVLQGSEVQPDELSTVINLVRLQYEESQQENGYWHDTVVTGFQTKTYAATGDVEEVYRRTEAARLKVLSEAQPAGLLDNIRTIFPHPCRSRYTALSMVPQDRLINRLLRGVVNAWAPSDGSHTRRALLLLGTAAAVAGLVGVVMWSRKPKQSSTGAASHTAAHTAAHVK